MISPDLEKRGAQIDTVCERLVVADEVGALGCVNYAGTYDLASSTAPHPKNLTDECFDLIVEVVRQILDTVKPRRASFLLEMMPAVFPDSADSYVTLLKAVDRPSFRVHLDPRQHHHLAVSIFQQHECHSGVFRETWGRHRQLPRQRYRDASDLHGGDTGVPSGDGEFGLPHLSHRVESPAWGCAIDDGNTCPEKRSMTWQRVI